MTTVPLIPDTINVISFPLPFLLLESLTVAFLETANQEKLRVERWGAVQIRGLVSDDMGVNIHFLMLWVKSLST